MWDYPSEKPRQPMNLGVYGGGVNSVPASHGMCDIVRSLEHEAATPKKSYACKHCGTAFPRPVYLAHHVRREHGRHKDSTE